MSERFEREFNFGVEAFTLEMGGQEVIDFAEGEKDALGILAYLACRGVLDS